MKILDYNELSKKFISIVKKETPEKSIDKIASFINPKTEKKFGKKKAFELYVSIAFHSVKYDKKLHENNYTGWYSQVQKNIDMAKKHIS